jgi:hypothetical protein
MRVIQYPRRGGKTDALIRQCAKANGYIVVQNRKLAGEVSDRARVLGCDLNFPITFDEFLSGAFDGRGVRELFIDDLDVLVARLARGTKVSAVSVTATAVEKAAETDDFNIDDVATPDEIARRRKAARDFLAKVSPQGGHVLVGAIDAEIDRLENTEFGHIDFDYVHAMLERLKSAAGQ